MSSKREIALRSHLRATLSIYSQEYVVDKPDRKALPLE
jgi:hypothetical protein